MGESAGRTAAGAEEKAGTPARSSGDRSGTTQPVRTSSRGRTILRATGLVVLLVWLGGFVDWRELTTLLSAAVIPLVVLTFAVHVFDSVLMAVKWQWLLKAFSVEVPIIVPIGAYFRGRVFTLVFPSILGIDTYKGFTVWRRGNPIGPVASSIFVERFLGAFSSLMFLAVLLPWAVQVLAVPYPKIIGAAGIAFFVAGFLAVNAGVRNVDRLPTDLSFRVLPARVNRALAGFVAAVRSTRHQRVRILGYFVASIAEKALYGIAVYFAAKAIGVESLRFLDVLSLSTLVALLERLPISLAGLGVREGLLVGLFHILGIPPTEAVATALLIRAIELSVTGASGLWWILGSQGVETGAFERIQAEMREQGPAARVSRSEPIDFDIPDKRG